MSKPPSTDVYWHSLKPPAPSQALSGDVQTTVAVIGGGMAGLSCAQRLHAAGIPVVLIERDFCGSGASGKTSGFVTPDSEIELSSLVGTYGAKKARRMWEFVVSGVSLIRENIQRHGISCDYQVEDSLFVANSASGLRHVREENEARKKFGYASTLYVREDMKNVLGSEDYEGAVRYPETFGMNSYAYCLAMRDVLRSAGVSIYENTAAERIDGREITTAHGRITADHIIVCADRFIPDLGALKKEIYHVQTFLGVTKPLSPAQVKVLFPKDSLMVWDTDLVYNYFRLTGGNRLLIGGGDVRDAYAHEAAKDMSRMEKKLSAYLRKKFPELEVELEYLWSGMLGVSKDLLPIMGTDKKNARIWYVGAATGLPWAAALGNYAADRLINGRNEFDEDFSPDRKFVIGPRLQSLLSTPLTFALSNAKAKYL